MHRVRRGMLFAAMLFPWLGGVAVGQTFSGMLNAGNPKGIHKTKLEKGKYYKIDLTSGQFDTYLRIQNTAGIEIAKDDDGGQGLNARLLFTPPQTAEYDLVADSFAGNGQGKYVLEVAMMMPAGPPQKIMGKLDANSPIFKKLPHHTHKMKMESGKLYVIDLTSTQFDPIVGIRNAGATNLITADDDSGEDFNARLVYVPTLNGTYELLCGSRDKKFGDFSLSIQVMDEAKNPEIKK